MARRITPSQLRSQLRQVESKLRQAASQQKRAVDQFNREVRAYNERQRRAVNEYNREARAHNARVRSNRQKLEQALRQLRSSSTTQTRRVTVSAQSVHRAFVRIEENRGRGVVYPEDLFALAEEETANSLRAANALDGNQAADEDEAAALQSTTLSGELEAFSPDLASRWSGALFSLNPRNPDAARHFCTSARECVVVALDVAAPDDVVERELESCDYTDDGRLTRRSKLRYLLIRKGLLDEAVEAFVNEDVEDILRLFRVFNDGAHGAAGRFNLNELVAVKQRAESGIRFLHRLVH